MDLTYNYRFFDDLRGIIRYYKDRNINCEKIIFDIFKATEFLKIFPRMGTPYENDFIKYDFRYILAGKYVIFYKVDEIVYILKVLHTRRDVDSIIFEELVSV